MSDSLLRKINACLRATAVYKENMNADPSVREAKFISALYPEVLSDLAHGELFAGTRPAPYILLLSPQAVYPAMNGYCANVNYMKQLAASYPQLSNEINDMADFWSENCTAAVDYKNYQSDYDICNYVRHGFDKIGEPIPKSEKVSSPIVTSRVLRIAGSLLDYDKLLTLGLCGLESEINARIAENGNNSFYDGLFTAINVVKATIKFYLAQALEMKKTLTPFDAYNKDLDDMIVILENILIKKPATMREAIQLAWIFGINVDIMSFTRMDIWLGDFYVNDIEAGRIDDIEAKRLLAALWNQIFDTIVSVDGRIFVGGMGRRNEANADKFALMVMDVVEAHRKIVPNFTMRTYDGQNPELLDKALKVIGGGALYPMLYNDSVYVDGVQRMTGATWEDAEKYLPIGCGEMVLDHVSTSSPNTAASASKFIEAVFCDGGEFDSDLQRSTRTGSLKEFDTFEKFYAAFEKQIRFGAYVAAKTAVAEYDVLQKQCAFLFISLVYDDCIAKGKSLVNGGVRYKGGCCEGFGFTDCGNSMYNIKRFVYDEKRFTLEEMEKMLRANFEGYEDERKLLLDSPKFGNNISDVDEMTVRIMDSFNLIFNEEGKKLGLDYYEISNVNPGGIDQGLVTGATPDGRLQGTTLAIGNSPVLGTDKSGITAMLSSVAKQDANNGGFITNIKISKEMFSKHFDKTKSIIETYFDQGGQQLNITAVNKGDLEDAIKHPENYPNLLVRVGGWSGIFVELDPVLQRDILARTMY